MIDRSATGDQPVVAEDETTGGKTPNEAPVSAPAETSAPPHPYLRAPSGESAPDEAVWRSADNAPAGGQAAAPGNPQAAPEIGTSVQPDAGLQTEEGAACEPGSERSAATPAANVLLTAQGSVAADEISSEPAAPVQIEAPGSIGEGSGPEAEVVPFVKPAPRPAQPPRVLAVANQKGGVGKTTTAINLGTALAAIGERVLIVDLDPQGNASTGLGIDRKARNVSTYDVLTGAASLREAVLPTAVPQLFMAPSILDLSGIELEIGQARDRATRLRNALNALNDGERSCDFTYVLVDCPPSLNLLTVNAMAAADSILVPLQCEFFALEGLSQLLKTVEQVKSSLNPKLSIHGIVLTMYDSRNNLANQVVADVREFMGSKVYDTIIPRNVRISEAPSYGKPVLVYDLKCVGSEAYLRLATEVIQREKAYKAG